MKVKETKSAMRVLQVLFESANGLEPFTAYRRSKLPSDEFFKRYFYLVEHGYVDEVDGIGRISISGRQLVLENISRLTPGRKEWRQVPSRFLKPAESVANLYIPNVDMLSKKSFIF